MSNDDVANFCAKRRQTGAEMAVNLLPALRNWGIICSSSDRYKGFVPGLASKQRSPERKVLATFTPIAIIAIQHKLHEGGPEAISAIYRRSVYSRLFFCRYYCHFERR
jgi:hypothetical protein